MVYFLDSKRAKHIKASPHAYHCSEENNVKKHGTCYTTKDESSERILTKVSLMVQHFLYASFILGSFTVCIYIVEGETGCWRSEVTWRIVHSGGNILLSKFSWRFEIGLWRCYFANNCVTAASCGRACMYCWGGKFQTQWRKKEQFLRI